MAVKKLVPPKVVRKAKQPTTGSVVLSSKKPPAAAAPKTFKSGAPYRDVKKGDDVYRVYADRSKGMKRLTPAKKTAPTGTTVTEAPPVDPLAAAVEAGAGTKFDPAFSSLAAQERAQGQRARDIPAWFSAYQAEIAAANKAAADTGARVQQGMAAFTNGLSANDAAGASSMQSQMVADAAARGATVDPATLERAINAASVRRENATGLGNLLGINVEATADRGRGTALNASAQKLQARIDSGKEAAKLLAKKGELEKERGDFKVTYKRQLESDAMDQALKAFLTNNQVEVANTNAQTAAQKAAADAAAKKAAAKAKATTPNQWGYTPRDWAKLTPAQRQQIMKKVKTAGRPAPRDTSGEVNQWGYTNAQWKKLTPGQRQAIMKKVKADGRAPSKPKAGPNGKSPYLGTGPQNTAKDKLDSTVTTGKALKANYTEAEVRELLLNGRAAQTVEKDGKKLKIPAVPKHDKRWVNVAMDIIYLTGISQPNVAALHKAGIKVKPLGYKVLPKGYKRPEPKTSSVVTSTLSNLGLGR
jgi:predicted Fe-S protein YdhL (DUF1289 family)